MHRDGMNFKSRPAIPQKYDGPVAEWNQFASAIIHEEEDDPFELTSSDQSHDPRTRCCPNDYRGSGRRRGGQRGKQVAAAAEISAASPWLSP
jgi:hypothetical protein